MAAVPPDLTYFNSIKAQYLQVQKAYLTATQLQATLTLELAQKETKADKLLDEINIIVDQIEDSDYKRLKPAKIDYFSDGEEPQTAQIIVHDSSATRLVLPKLGSSTGNGNKIIIGSNNGQRVVSRVRKERTEEPDENDEAVKRIRLEHSV